MPELKKGDIVELHRDNAEYEQLCHMYRSLWHGFDERVIALVWEASSDTDLGDNHSVGVLLPFEHITLHNLDGEAPDHHCWWITSNVTVLESAGEENIIPERNPASEIPMPWREPGNIPEVRRNVGPF